LDRISRGEPRAEPLSYTESPTPDVNKTAID